jgi:hypothetical protein
MKNSSMKRATLTKTVLLMRQKPRLALMRLPMSQPSENAAWVATARIVLNLDELITRE